MAKRLREQTSDLLSRDLAGILSSLRAPHSIADGECEIHFLGGTLAHPSEVMNFTRIKLQSYESVFVVGSKGPAFGASGPLKPVGRTGNHHEAQLLSSWQNRRQFKIHNAEAPVRLSVGNVPNIGIVVSHAECFELREKFGSPL